MTKTKSDPGTPASVAKGPGVFEVRLQPESTLPALPFQAAFLNRRFGLPPARAVLVAALCFNEVLR